MWFKNLVRFWMNWKERQQGNKAGKQVKPIGRWARSLLSLETLEDRVTPTVNVFLNGAFEGTDEAGLNTAIVDANALFGVDDITFTVTGSNEIVLTADLTTITDSVNIGNASGPLITIDGQDLYRQFYINGPATPPITVLLQDMTLTNGDSGGGSSGGAVLSVNEDVTLRDMVVTNSYGYNHGGGVAAYGGNLTLDNTDVTNNDAFYDGGGVAWLYFGPDAAVGSLTITNNSTVQGNEAGFGLGNTNTGSGGGVFFYTANDFDGDFLIENSLIDNNYADTYDDIAATFTDQGGGGVAVIIGGDLNGTITVDPTIISNNTTTGDGGGMLTAIAGDLNGAFLIAETDFFNNTARNDGGGLALYVGFDVTDGATIDILDSDFYFNVAGAFNAVAGTGYGGGLYIHVDGYLYGDITIADTGASLDSGNFYANTARYGSGGGAYIYVGFDLGAEGIATGSITVDGSDFLNNYAYVNGGGLSVSVGSNVFLDDLEGPVTIANATFNDNEAHNNNGGGAYLFFYGVGAAGTVNVTNSSFDNNDANQGNGGGLDIYVLYDLNGAVNVSGSNFNLNIARNGGGIDIDVQDFYGSITVDDTDFTNNYGTFYGGGLNVDIANYFYSGGSVSITNSTFDANDTGGSGGGANISVGYDAYYGAIAITNTDFTNNTAYYNGGGFNLNVAGFDDFYDSPFDFDTFDDIFDLVGSSLDITITDSTFVNNQAGSAIYFSIGYGGGANLFIGGDMFGDLTVTNTAFTGNDATRDGGGLKLYVTGDEQYLGFFDAAGIFGNVAITDSTFTANNAVNGGGLDIYTVFDLYGDITLDNADFNNNYASNNGGGMGISGDGLYGALSILNSLIDFNTAQNGDGGGAYIDVLYFEGSLTVDGTTFDNNDAGADGGGLSLAVEFYAGRNATPGAGDIDILNSFFTNNTAAFYGGGANIAVGNVYSLYTTFTVDNTVFDSNTTLFNDGGALSLYVTYDFNSYFDILDSTFTNNSAGDDGGGVNFYVGDDFNGYFSIEHTTFDNNFAGDDGGGMSMEVGGEMDGTVDLYCNVFTDNSAVFDGGGLAFYFGLQIGFGGRVFISDTTVDGNTAGYYGGGLYFHDDGARVDVLIEDSTFSNNDADYGGGAWILTYDGLFSIVNSTFAYNTAIDGAGIYVDAFTPSQALTIYNSTIAYNYADDDGGGIYSVDSNVLLVSTILSGNTAGDVGENVAGLVTFTSYYSLFSDAFQPFNVADLGGTIFGELADLGPLQDNGSPCNVETMVPNPGSPAINAGSNRLNRGTDQSGNPRDQDGQTDIGAAETEPPDPLVPGNIVVGLTENGNGVVKVFEADGDLLETIIAFAGHTGGVSVAQGDVDGDGELDIIVGALGGDNAHIKVFDGADIGLPGAASVLEDFHAFDGTAPGGVYVAAGDIDGDGLADIVAGAGARGGPRVSVYKGNDIGVVLMNFFAFEETFAGGVTVAAGNFNGDSFDDVVVGAGPTGGPRVQIFDGTSFAGAIVLQNFYAFEVTYAGGINVAAGDVDGDGLADLIVARASGQLLSPPDVVKVYDNGVETALLAASFNPFPTFGARVGAVDLDTDGNVEIVTGASVGGGPHIKGFNTPALDLIASFYATDPANAFGVWVA